MEAEVVDGEDHGGGEKGEEEEDGWVDAGEFYSDNVYSDGRSVGDDGGDDD